ncbi:MAG: SMC-Scp complex subunit ScpB [Clostridia bacterium]|jgi:segregation and condensation protein B|nr:SMC-Scp complex subunit ScpB [Clostridiaceae bacterium]
MLDQKTIEGIIEAMLFVHGDPLPLSKICEAIGMDESSVYAILESMMKKYSASDRGIQLRKIKDSYQFCTKQEYASYVSKIYVKHISQTLSNAAFETLAIIAYNEPVTKATIEQIRGVSSDSSVTKLLERNLIREAGKLDAPGRPVLYETTEEFLRCFGLSSLDELPPVDTLLNADKK